MQADVLIQNVSDQCIPNLVAVQTYKPNRIVWIYTQEKKDVLLRLQKASGCKLENQEAWRVDARDSEALNAELQHRFKQLAVHGRLVYHLTSGTKSMSLQGMFALMKQEHLHGVGVVMDPQTQCFDTVLPHANNNSCVCASLSFQQILTVHGSWQQHESGRSMKSLGDKLPLLNRLKTLNAAIMQQLKGALVCGKDEAKAHGGFYLRGLKSIPNIIQEALEIAQVLGVIQSLRFSDKGFHFKAIHTDNPIDYIKNMWMEDWVAAVLEEHDDGHWKGGFSGVKVNIKEGKDYQEFDFLGARKNHLVYWSCKNTNKLSSAQLFEIDALRDEVSGRDFHIAGLVHTVKADVGHTAKAKRLGIMLVNVFDVDAEEKLVNISCR